MKSKFAILVLMSVFLGCMAVWAFIELWSEGKIAAGGVLPVQSGVSAWGLSVFIFIVAILLGVEALRERSDKKSN